MKASGTVAEHIGAQGLQESIASEIDTLYAQAEAEAEAAAAEAAEEAGYIVERRPTPLAFPDEDSPIMKRVRFLQLLQKQLDADPELLRFVDSFVGRRVEEGERRQQVAFAAAERRQYAAAVRLTVVSSVISLGAGWLLSLLTPATVLAHVLPR
jgi:hypothetical protein